MTLMTCVGYGFKFMQLILVTAVYVLIIYITCVTGNAATVKS